LSGREPPGSQTCTLLGPAGTSAEAEARDTTGAEHGPSTTAGDELSGSELADATDAGAVDVTLDGAELADDAPTGPAIVDARGAAHPPTSPTTQTAAAVTQRRSSIRKGR
jgi:hypothetical protein